MRNRRETRERDINATVGKKRNWFRGKKKAIYSPLCHNARSRSDNSVWWEVALPKDFQLKREKKKKKYESCNSPLWSSFPWSYFFHGDWLFSRAAVSPSPWWFCTRARTRTRYGRTRSASCPAPCAAGCPARGWICGIDLWSACALSPARLSSPRSRPGSLTFCFDKERQRNWRLMYSFLIWMEFSEDAFVCFDDIEDAFDSMMKYGIIINCLYREELVIQNNPIYFFHDL